MTPIVNKADERIQRMFGQIAPWYDTLNHVLSLNIDKRWRRSVVKRVPPVGVDPILDCCTGTGDLAFEYRKATNAPITGSDFTPGMLDLARQKAEHRKLAGVEFIEADAQNLPFENDRFQIVSVAFGLRNVCDWHRGLAEMIRVAKPGGRLAILEFSKPTAPIIGPLYRGYFKYLLPAVGQVLSRNKESAYRYLPASVLQFPDGEAFAKHLREAGLRNVTFTPLTFGIATLYVGEKAL